MDKNRNFKLTAADLYNIQPSFRRFNQKYNMTRQGLWKKNFGSLQKRLADNQRLFVKESRKGYTILDKAFLFGSGANLENTEFVINRPNKNGNSWESAFSGEFRSTPLLATPEHGEKLDKWKGNPTEAARLIQKMGRVFGADLVDFCLLDRRWVYSHWFDEKTKKDYPIKFSDEPGYEGIKAPCQLDDKTQVIPADMKYVVVLIHEMGKDAMATSPNMTALAETNLTYSKISFTIVSVAEFIRGLGFNAIPSANCTALNIPLAIDAGLGQLGRNSKLINPLYGPRCRISKVITDLPLAANKPISFGITEFCNHCKKCARHCPVGAIPLGERSFEPLNECSHRGVLQWQMDHKKCRQFWAEVGTNCGICIRVCPFNKGLGKIHDVTRWIIKNFKFADPFILKLDDLMGYGKHKSAEKFWRKI